MRRYLIRPIEDVIQLYKQLKKEYKKIVTIVITKDNYCYSFLPTLQLDFSDVFKGGHNFIEQRHVEKIQKIMPKIKTADLIVVSCDAGISRSPAVASAIACHLKDWHDYNIIKIRFPYMNNDIYEFVKSSL